MLIGKFARNFLLLSSFLLAGSGAVRGDQVGDDSDTMAGIIYYNTANYTSGSPFKKNLDVVWLHLINGSETYRYGRGEDEAFGYCRCFFNTSESSCKLCTELNTNLFELRIPFSVGARFWRNDSAEASCYLRYENYNFFVSISPRGSLKSPTEAGRLGNSSKSGMSVKVGVGTGGAVVVLSIVIAAFVIRRRRKSQRFLLRMPHTDLRYSQELEGVRRKDAAVFRYETMKAATRGFNKDNELGQGGFGTVYKGVLKDGTKIAVKKLSLQSRQGWQEFINEISIIRGIQHKNLVQLKGYCIEEERLLVYEFMENGSLDKMLFGRLGLAWKTRHAIILGVARGLAYLHEDSHDHVQVIHRDIKASNILLDKELNPKISDFGLSKLFDRGKGYTSTRIAGTLGYLAPEYATRGRLTPKVDVFSFGVLVLEMISGRRCNDETLSMSEQLLLEWVWKLRQGGSTSEGLERAVDKRLLVDETYNSEEANRAIHIALLCTHEDEGSRPMMGHVVAMFQGLMARPRLPSEPPSYFVQINALKLNSSVVTEDKISPFENTLTAR